MSEGSVPAPGAGRTGAGAQQAWPGSNAEPDPRRWLILVVIAIAQLMVVLDATVMNIALPSAQRALDFTNVDRQWVVTAYSLSFGSLLLFCGRLSDLIGRKVIFITGLAGFAAASAVGGASVNFTMLVAARACQGAFGAMLAPAALSLLATTFADPSERGKAFGIYGSVAAGGGAVGLLLGGVLTSYLSWRWCLYINLFFAGIAISGALSLLRRQSGPPGAQLDIPGVLLVSSGVFCLVYGFSNAATHDWSTPSTWGFLAAGVILLIAFGAWLTRATSPLLPPRVVVNRNRGAAYLGILVTAAGMFGIFLFLTYYLQDTLRYSPVITGVAFLPMVVCIAIASNLSNIVLMPRIGPKPIVSVGLVLAAAGTAWLTGIGPHSGYAETILGPIMVAGFGLGLMFSTAFNTGTFGVAPRDAGVASATVNTGQQLGGSIGTALLNTIATSAATAYLASHLSGRPAPGVVQLSLIHGYTTAFWWVAGIFLAGAVVCGSLMRRGPLRLPQPDAGPASAAADATQAGATARTE
ncbi:MFS transporter [Trebonia sp.]|uniref:MFS transporter n=1 Tax=Trebonia sp. TaxID=2767075 RepID=UPI00262E789E|nr:MFS transporter [Trebonia sp.]